ncbi:hypothetical protein PCE1_003944 [Barthelona sp. PCE]
MSETLQLLLVGSSSVGKTSLLLRFCESLFQESYVSTIGIDFRVKEVLLPNQEVVKLQIFDTAGQERFKGITSSLFRTAQGVILMFDVTYRESFVNLRSWMQLLEKHCESDFVLEIAANKIDCDDWQVTQEEIEAFVKEYNLTYTFTSAKTGQGVDEVFQTVATKVLSRINSFNDEENVDLMASSDIKVDESTCAC